MVPERSQAAIKGKVMKQNFENNQVLYIFYN
jgi:hypothetical protein